MKLNKSHNSRCGRLGRGRNRLADDRHFGLEEGTLDVLYDTRTAHIAAVLARHLEVIFGRALHLARSQRLEAVEECGALATVRLRASLRALVQLERAARRLDVFHLV